MIPGVVDHSDVDEKLSMAVAVTVANASCDRTLSRAPNSIACARRHDETLDLFVDHRVVDDETQEHRVNRNLVVVAVVAMVAMVAMVLSGQTPV